MKLVRALIFLLLVAPSALQPFATASATVAVQAPAPARATDEALETQVRVVETAYNLLMDRYVQPLESAALLRAGWEELGRDANGKAEAPGPAPTFCGDPATDCEAFGAAFASYRE